MKLRTIAKVVVFNGMAYQTQQFSKSIYLGDPINVCNVLSDQGCQELAIFFVRSAPSIEFVSDILSVCRSPVSIGGVGDTVGDFDRIVSSGAEKIVISDSLWTDHKKLVLLNKRYGRQAVAGSVDYIEKNGTRIVVTGKKRNKNVGLLDELLLKLPQDLLGEVILNNVTRDGCGCGLDYEIMKEVRKKIPNIPVIFSGGYKGECMDDSSELDGLITGTHISLFGRHMTPLVNYPEECSVYNA